MTPREVLQKTPFFTDVLSAAELDRLAAKLEMRTFPRGVTIVRQGDLGASMFVLVGGKVTVSVHSRSGEERVATLGSGDIVGEMSLLTGARRNATVVAARQVTALEIAKPALEDLLIGSAELIGRFAGRSSSAMPRSSVSTRSTTGPATSVSAGPRSRRG